MRSRYETIVALLTLKADAASLDLSDIARANGLLAFTEACDKAL